MEKQTTLEERFGKCPYATAQSLISGKWAVLILLYLADRHEGVWPRDEDARAYAQSAVCDAVYFLRGEQDEEAEEE